MRVATLQDGRREGRLIIVTADRSRAVKATAAFTLLEALDSWSTCEPILRAQAIDLVAGLATSFNFNSESVLAPLPRAPQWLDASAFRSHVDIVSRAWQVPSRFSEQYPLMYQGASDDLLPAQGPIYLPDESQEIDLEAEVAVIVDEVPMGISADAALDHIKLIMLANDVSLRAFGPREMQTGFGFLQAKPSTVFSPLAVTPDELGDNWRGGRLHRPVSAYVNGDWIGSPDAAEMHFSFGDLIAHAAKTRRLSAGTIIGSGTVSNFASNVGSTTLVEKRAIEQLQCGAVRTSYLKFGDRVEIDALGEDGASIFGRIDHQILQFAA